MKKLARFKSFLILSTSLILSSCGGGNSSSKFKTTFSIDAILEPERNLTADEVKIATRICDAYRSKSVKFRTTDYGTQFVFSAKRTDCQNVVTNYDVTTIMKYDAQDSLAYIPVGPYDPNLKFNQKVQTDDSGYLAQLCPKIWTNQQVSNTTLQGNAKIQILFFKQDLDGFMLKYFNKQSDNSYKIDSAETFKVPTTTSNGNIIGMDQFYSGQKACASRFDKIEFSNFEQNFTSR